MPANDSADREKRITKLDDLVLEQRIEIEQLKEAWDALPRSEAVNQLIEAREEIKRLEAKLRVIGNIATNIRAKFKEMQNAC